MGAGGDNLFVETCAVRRAAVVDEGCAVAAKLDHRMKAGDGRVLH